jgi:hypothetical protein
MVSLLAQGANQSLILLLKSVFLAEMQQIPILPDQSSNPQSIAPLGEHAHHYTTDEGRPTDAPNHEN